MKIWLGLGNERQSMLDELAALQAAVLISYYWLSHGGERQFARVIEVNRDDA